MTGQVYALAGGDVDAFAPDDETGAGDEPACVRAGSVSSDDEQERRDRPDDGEGDPEDPVQEHLPVRWFDPPGRFPSDRIEDFAPPGHSVRPYGEHRAEEKPHGSESDAVPRTYRSRSLEY